MRIRGGWLSLMRKPGTFVPPISILNSLLVFFFLFLSLGSVDPRSRRCQSPQLESGTRDPLKARFADSRRHHVQQRIRSIREASSKNAPASSSFGFIASRKYQPVDSPFPLSPHLRKGLACRRSKVLHGIKQSAMYHYLQLSAWRHEIFSNFF